MRRGFVLRVAGRSDWYPSGVVRYTVGIILSY